MTEQLELATVEDDAPPPDGGRGTSGARLMAELRQANARAERAERELQRTRQGAAYVVGSLFVGAAKNPRRLVLLPRDLWRVWRLRRARRSVIRPTTATAVRPREVLDLDATRLLLPRLSVVAPGRRLTIVGALSHASHSAWSSCAAVSCALPQDGAALIEAVDPDVVIIDTAAALPGESWAHLGDPAAPDRLVAAGAMVDAAHALGRPVVLLRMTPPAHTALLADLAARCDLVVDGPGSHRESAWHPGIDALAWAAQRPVSEGLLVPPASGSPAARRLRDALHAASTHSVSLDPSAPVDVAWARALAQASAGVADPALVPDRLLGASRISLGLLASGRRVLGAADADLATLLDRRPSGRPAAVLTPRVDVLTDIARSGPSALTAEEHRGAFAAILLAASAPVQLTRLAERLGISSRPRACWDVALVAGDVLDTDRLLSQSWLPREVITDGEVTTRAREALEDAGIVLLHVTPGAPIDTARLGLASTFVATQVDLSEPHDILDLLAGTLLGMPPGSHPTDARLVSAR